MAFDRIEGGAMRGLMIFSLIGFIALDMVYISAIMNYAVQSQMLIDLLRSVRRLIEMKLLNEDAVS